MDDEQRYDEPEHFDISFTDETPPNFEENVTADEAQLEPEKKSSRRKKAQAEAVSDPEPESTIPGLDLSQLYPHMPPAFVDSLTDALHARGLVQPGDYFAPHSGERFQAAMLSVIKRDFLNARTLAKQAWQEQVRRKRGQGK